MATYRKKPILVDAFKWTGNREQEQPIWITKAIENGTIYFVNVDTKNYIMVISALAGNYIACPGDYIIKSANGEICPCKPDIFEKIYEKIEESKG